MKEITLSNGMKVKVSDCDYEELNQYIWHYATVGYAHMNISKKDGRDGILMHRHILGLRKGDGKIVDHINGDGLDNRRENLRICTKTQNQQNQKPRHTKRSKYKGVGYFVRDKKWRARIVVNGKDIELGKFGCETCAAIAYDEAAVKYHREFAWLNREHFEINEYLHDISDPPV